MFHAVYGLEFNRSTSASSIHSVEDVLVYGRTGLWPRSAKVLNQDSSKRWMQSVGPSYHTSHPESSRRVVILYRDPLQRYVSAFNDKVRCGRTGQATETVRKLMSHVSLADQSTTRDCLSFREFVLALSRAHSLTRAWMLDRHLRPAWMLAGASQQRACDAPRPAARNSDTLLKLTIAQWAAMTPQIEEPLGLHRVPMPHLLGADGGAASMNASRLEAKPEELAHLCWITKPEYEWLDQLDVWKRQCRRYSRKILDAQRGRVETPRASDVDKDMSDAMKDGVRVEEGGPVQSSPVSKSSQAGSAPVRSSPIKSGPVIMSVPILEPQMHFLAMCSLLRNEAKYLPEWIEHSLLVGVQHLYL